MKTFGLIALSFLIAVPLKFPGNSAIPVPKRINPKSVANAVKWLARHQEDNGGWAVREYTANCTQKGGEECAPNPGKEEFDTGVTSLALLAMLRSGYGIHSEEEEDGIMIGDSLRKGIARLISLQAKDGCVGSRSSHQFMYNHAIATYALTEAVASLESDGDVYKEGEKLRLASTKAVDFLVESQNPGEGWRYSFRSGDNDSSVTGWGITALASAKKAGIEVPAKAFQEAVDWLDKVSDPKSWKTGYTHKGTGKVYVPGMNERFDHHETLTAAACLGRILYDPKAKKTEWVKKGMDLVLKDLPHWDNNAIDFYYWYYATAFLANCQKKLPKAWEKWLKKTLEANQNVKTGSCRHGSWEPVGRWCGMGGRVYATALNTISLDYVYGLPGNYKAPRKISAKKKKPPGDSTAKWIKSKIMLARNYHRGGMKEKACTILKDVIKKKPEHPETKNARKLLEEWE